MSSEFDEPIQPDNIRTRRKHRPDPDATSPATPAPVTEQAHLPEQRRATTPPASDGGLLASMIASKQAAPLNQERLPPTPDVTLNLGDLIRARRRRVDPFEDWTGDGTRQLPWIQDAITIVADLTGRTRQEVQRDAILGITPIPPEVLDGTFQERYGYRRPTTPSQ